MMKRRVQTLVLLLWAAVLGFATPRAAHAQAVTTAAVGGRVTNAQGQPVPGARVTVTNTETGSVSSVGTRSDGRYLIPGLQPGTYRVAVSSLGLAAQSRENVRLSLGQTAPLDFTLAPEAVALEGITVVGASNGVISTSHTGAQTVVSDSTLRRAPTITRDLQDFTRLVPQMAVTNSTTGAVSGGGRNNRYNQLQIDGTASNDLFGLSGSGTTSGQAGGKAITLEAVQEFQVVLAPFDVRQNGFTGASVNAITKSGTNRFQGTVSGFNRNENLTGRYLTSSDTLSRKLDQFTNTEFAGSFGGPIIRDRAFFFLAGESTHNERPSNYIAGIDPTQGITQGQASEVATYLQSKFGFDPGGTNARNIPQNSLNLFGRLDFNLGQNNRLTLRHNYIDAKRENFSSSAGSYSLSFGGYTQYSTTNSSVLQLNSSFGSGIFNELRIGYNRVRDHRGYPGSDFPRIQVNYGTRNVVAGSENSSLRNVLNQDAFELTNDLTIPAGSHTFTVGTNNEFSKFSNLFVQNVFGNYTFDSFADLQAGRPSRYSFSYLLPGGNAIPEFRVRRYSLYAEDRWDIFNTVQLTYGLRVDRAGLPDRPALNQSVLTAYGRSNSAVPESQTFWNPRVGFNWDVTGDKTTQVRGGAGVFSGRNPLVWISNAYANTGLDYAKFTCQRGGANTTDEPPVFSADPNNQPHNCVDATGKVSNFAPPTEVDLVNPGFKSPQVARYSLGIDRQLPFGLVGTLEGLYTQTLHDILYQNLAVYPLEGRTAEGRQLYATRPASYAPGVGNVIDVTNTSLGFAYNVTAQIQRPFRGGWDFSAAYTFSRAKDVNPLGSSTAFSQWSFNQTEGDPNNPGLRRSDYEIPHRFVVTTSRRFNLIPRAATDLSLVYIGQSGQPYSYRYNGDVNGDGSTGNDLVYVPRDASEIRFTSASGVTPAQSWQNLNDFIERVGCLREHRGEILQRNECRTPWLNRVDFRVAQSLSPLRGQNAQITLDILNFGNLLNSNWGLSQFISNQTDNLLSLQTGSTPDANGHLQYQAFRARQDIFSTQNLDSRYQIQLGLRYSF